MARRLSGPVPSPVGLALHRDVSDTPGWTRTNGFLLRKEMSFHWTTGVERWLTLVS